MMLAMEREPHHSLAGVARPGRQVDADRTGDVHAVGPPDSARGAFGELAALLEGRAEPRPDRGWEQRLGATDPSGCSGLVVAEGAAESRNPDRKRLASLSTSPSARAGGSPPPPSCPPPAR